MYAYKNIRLYFYFWRWYLCGAEKQSQRVCPHEVVGKRKSQWTMNLHSLQLSRDLQQFLFFVNYGYADVSLLCFPLVMLYASHWLLAQAWFCGHTPSVTITEFNHVHMSRWYSDIFDRMHLFEHPPYSQHQWAWWHFGNPLDVAVSTSTDTQHLWTWWHFGDHAALINLSVNNIRRIHTRRSR